MHNTTDNIMAVLMLINLALTASSRLNLCISLVSLQGVALGFLPLFSHNGLNLRTAFLAVVVVAMKGVVFPRLLMRAVRGANVRREVEPFVGYGASILVGILLLGISFWVGNRLPLPVSAVSSDLVVPGAIGAILTGLFLLTSRKTAVTQVMGYLVMENGIAAFGLAVVPEVPMLIELGILLDIFVGVFVMAIVIWHISREFDHMNADQLSALKG
ncbi:MAG: NADH-quinone oxidoreductase subunit K [bacterium]